jgi:hypothetical protein
MGGRRVLEAADIGGRGSFGLSPPQVRENSLGVVFAWEGD